MRRLNHLRRLFGWRTGT